MGSHQAIGREVGDAVVEHASVERLCEQADEAGADHGAVWLDEVFAELRASTSGESAAREEFVHLTRLGPPSPASCE